MVLRVKHRTESSFNEMAKRYERAVVAGNYRLNEEIFDKSQDDVVRDTEELALSGEMGLLDSDKTVNVSSYDTSYAVRIHEDSSLDAKRKQRVDDLKLGKKVRGATRGKSRFLADPFNEVCSQADSKLPKLVKKSFDDNVKLSSLRDKRGKKS